MHRIQLYSPKAARMLVLFSYDSLAAWALAESCPLVDAFCEYPGYVNVDGTRVMADLWVRGCGREQYVKIEGGIDLSSERPDQVPTFADVEVARVSSDWLLRYQVWIDNWLQINPYLVANARFVTPEMLDRVAALFDDARPLFDAEHAVRDIDTQLARTAAGPPCALQCVAALLQQRPLAQLPHPGIQRPVRPVRSVSRGPSAR